MTEIITVFVTVIIFLGGFMWGFGAAIAWMGWTIKKLRKDGDRHESVES